MLLGANCFRHNFGIPLQARVSSGERRFSFQLLKTSGPSNSWTIHGLWPDHCDGTYDSNCDSSRAYTNITQILQFFGKTDLLSYMNQYWLDENGDNESFWEHEWGKHGTCISTLKPSCYTGYTATQEVPDFFQKTVDLFKTLDSYTVLSLSFCPR
jgi:ribonuclease T2